MQIAELMSFLSEHLQADAIETHPLVSFRHATCVACQIIHITEMLCQGRPAQPLALVLGSVLTERSHSSPQEAELGFNNSSQLFPHKFC